MRSLVLFALVFVLTLSGCHCSKKSDEEILLERIDTTSVHLYLATKVAVLKADTSPEAAAAKKHLLDAVAVLARAAEDANRKRNITSGPESAPSGAPAAPPPPPLPPPPASPPGNTIPASAVSGTPSPTPPASAAPPSVELSPADIATLVKALWGLRQEGKALVKARREDDLPALLPTLLGPDHMSPELAPLLDSNTEHSLFLAALFALKFHPRNPVPVPVEILLYEAWMTRAEAVKLPGWTTPVRAVKAMVYSQNELCDLTAAEGAGLEAEKGSLTAEKLDASFKAFGAKGAAMTPKAAAELGAAARGVAHGAAVSCYYQRGESEKAQEELRLFIDAAHDAGVPTRETALLRAYLAYEKKDYETAKAALEEAKSDPSVDAETKREIEALIVDFTKKDDGAIRRFYSGAFFRTVCVKLFILRIEESGLFDEVLATESAQAIRGYLFATSKALASTKESIPSVDDAKKRGAELLDGLKK